MKNLIEIITEKLNRTTSSLMFEKLKIGSKTQVKTYKYSPKSLDELKNIIKDILKEEGPDANLNIIDVSDITNMNGLFNIMELGKPIEIGNIKIDDWNVSNVRIMRNMFLKCAKFNCDISNWDVSKVSDMSGMFYGCKEFNQDISKWNVSKVWNMNAMFAGSENFNQDISKWDVSNVKDMNGMFDGTLLEKNPPKWYKK
jgi:surface protein